MHQVRAARRRVRAGLAGSRFELLPADEVADAIMFAATRSKGVDVVTLRIEPLVQKIY